MSNYFTEILANTSVCLIAGVLAVYVLTRSEIQFQAAARGMTCYRSN